MHKYTKRKRRQGKGDIYSENNCKRLGGREIYTKYNCQKEEVRAGGGGGYLYQQQKKLPKGKRGYLQQEQLP